MRKTVIIMSVHWGKLVLAIAETKRYGFGSREGFFSFPGGCLFFSLFFLFIFSSSALGIYKWCCHASKHACGHWSAG